MATRSVTAIYERDQAGNWLAHLAEEDRCHTWARSLTSARAHIREAAELWLDELGVNSIDDLEFRDEVRVPHADEAQQLAALRARLDGDTRAMVRILLEQGLSVRDVATLVGLTPGRISQIAPRKSA